MLRKRTSTNNVSLEEKNKKLLSFFGAWKGTALDSDELWKKALKRTNKKSIGTIL